MVFVEFENLALLLCLSIRDNKSKFYGWPEELIRLMVDKIYTCSYCAKCMIPFKETYKCIPSIGPTPWHYLVTQQGWVHQNFHRQDSGTGCTMVPGNFSQDGYPQLEEFYDGMPICKFFELWGVRWRQVYTWMIAAEGYQSVDVSDDFHQKFQALKIVQAFTQAWQPP